MRSFVVDSGTEKVLDSSLDYGNLGSQESKILR